MGMVPSIERIKMILRISLVAGSLATGQQYHIQKFHLAFTQEYKEMPH